LKGISQQLRGISQALSQNSWSTERNLKFKLPKYGGVLTTRVWRSGIIDEINVKIIADSEVQSVAK
jgi:hypothetical protein